MRILILNPNTSEAFTATIQTVADEYKAADTEVVAISPSRGPRIIEGVYDALLSAAPSLEILISGEADFDGFIIACFSDHPVIYGAREFTRKPVIGIMEAALYTACMLGHRFSVVTTNDRYGPLLWDAVGRYGLAERCASIRPTGMGVIELESHGDQDVYRRIREEARSALEEDGAEVICLGCAGMAGLDKQLQAELDVPVVDGVVCALKLTEVLVGYGVGTSKARTYAPLSEKELVDLRPVFKQPYKT